MVSERRWRRRDEARNGSRDDPAVADPSDGRTAPSDGRYHRTLTADGDDDVAAFLELLEDEYAQRIFEALADEPCPARELVEACDASRATVYRRLKRLEEHGLVDSDVEFHHDGHHRKVFESTLVRATIELVDGSPQVRLTLTQPVEGESGPDPVPAD